jgi:RNA ligase
MEEGIIDEPQFIAFRKIPRLNRKITITEKIDGTNACICIGKNGEFLVGKRSAWIQFPKEDNHGFAAWAHANKAELLKLGVGYHFGEWWGKGINKRYSQYMSEKKFSLFNVSKWNDPELRPVCCDVVPVLGELEYFDTMYVAAMLKDLRINGSVACPGCPNPEGIVIYHSASGQLFKQTLENDAKPKGQVE